MKVRGLTYTETQLRFELAGLPSSRSTVTRYLREAGIVANRLTYKTRRFDPSQVDAAIARIIRAGTAAAAPARTSKRKTNGKT